MSPRRALLPSLFALMACGPAQAPIAPSKAAAVALAPPEDKMVKIPAGAFEMGSDAGAPSEKPVHRLEVLGFSLDVTEVTVASYNACVQAGRCTTDELDAFPGCNWGNDQRKDHPINCVDWEQANAYCAFVKKRLPTEKEWEYAARGGDGRVYPWGNDAPADQACWAGEGNTLGKGNRKTTCPVGAFPKGASPFGVMDMAGNVWEWTASSLCDYADPKSCKPARAHRGASFINFEPGDLRAANRSGNDPSKHYMILGFRCARSAS